MHNPGDFKHRRLPGNVLLVDIDGMPFGGFVLETKGKIALPNQR
jgi:hypothetical protein